MEIEMFSTYIVKAIFIYFTKNCDDVTGTESQFSLSKKKEPWDTFSLLHMLFTAVSVCQRLPKTSNLLGFDEFEMLCFLVQINVMHRKHECQFSLGRRTVATVNASNVGTLKTGLQHTGHISPTGFSRTHKPNIAYVQYVGDRSTQKTKPRRGDAGSGNAWGAVFMTTRDRGPWPVIRSPPPRLHSNKRGRKHTQSRQYRTLLTLTHLLIQSVALILCRWQCQ